MQVTLTPEQEAFVRQGVASGRYRNAEDAVSDALTRWAKHERSRTELLSALDEAETDLKTGQHEDYDTAALPTLAAELKREARVTRQKSS